MLQLPTIYKPPVFGDFGDDSLLRSIEWLESFPIKHENNIKKSEDRFEIRLQVKEYAPEEISVKTADGFVVVEGKHEEKQDDYGYIARQFVRRFQIPEGCKIEEVKSRLTGDGQLIITVPRIKVIKKDIVIPVTHESSKSKSKL